MDNHNHHLSKQQQQQQQEQEKQQDKNQQQEKQQDKHRQQQQQQEKQQDKDHQQQEQQEKQQDKDQQQQEQQKHEEQVAETEQKSPTASQSALTEKTTHSPPPDPSPVDSPLSSDTSSLSHGFSPPPTTQPNSKPPPAVVSRAELTSRDQSTATTTTTTTTTVDLEDQTQKLGSGSGKRLRPDLSILRRSKRDKMIQKALLGFRISAFVFSLVSFSVLAADKDQGWALDSFYRYKEFRFCLAVNVIGFVYSGIQALYLAYHLTSGKQKPRSQLRSYLDFVLDQILAYLLISASSSAAVRVDDWQSNWGNDKFPQMARASMALSLVAFIAFGLSSLVSGYNLCTFKSM